MNKYKVQLHKKGNECLPYIINVLANDTEEAHTKAVITIANMAYWPLCYNNMYDKMNVLIVDSITKIEEINKRVIQISLDILVGPDCDGAELAETVAQELNRRAFSVLGTSFIDDLTETYLEHYPELLEE
jgi:hypothetical protein